MRALLAILLCCVDIISASAREPTPRDYQVWGAVLGPDMGAGSVYVWHRVEPTSVFARGEEKSAVDLFPDVRPAAEEWASKAAELDLTELTAAAQSAAGRMLPVFPLVILDDRLLEKAVGKTPKPAWILCPRLISGAKAVYRLSWPAYREDGRVAYVICGMFSQSKGSIVTCCVEKDTSGRWRLGHIVMWDLLCWGGGWPDKCDTREFIDD